MKRELFPEFLEAADRKMAKLNVPVRDAATLLLVDYERKIPRLLVGVRKSSLAFMPELTVFPGGAADETDALMVSADELPDETERRLRLRVSNLSQRSAHGLALAAIRELYEETGLLYGIKQKPASAPEGWADFAKHGVTPAFSNLHLVARAITPPYRPRRFDTRFFLGDRKHVAKTVRMTTETDLEKIEWLSLAQILKRPLAHITRQLLADLAPLLQRNNRQALARPIPFYYGRGKKYFVETIG
jgi:8-oxo-dGTP pyrophosphatase MutT (NUDIX family)